MAVEDAYQFGVLAVQVAVKVTVFPEQTLTALTMGGLGGVQPV